MPPRRGVGIGRGIPEANAVLLEEIWSLHTRMEAIETTQKRAPDEEDDISSEKSYVEEGDEENETTKFIKMLAKLGGKEKIEIPMYGVSIQKS